MTHFFKCVWQNRRIRGLVWMVVSLVTLSLLLLTGLNWIGGRSWRATLASLEAAGETANFRQICSDPIPAEDNFCAIPLLEDLPLAVEMSAGGRKLRDSTPEKNCKRLEATKLPSWDNKGKPPPRLAEALLGQAYDLEPWAALFRRAAGTSDPGSGNAANEVLIALSKNDAVIKELTDGLSRTGAQWTPAMKTRRLLPSITDFNCSHYVAERIVSTMLVVRSIAAARTGDAQIARESAEIGLRMARANLDDPFLIGEFVGTADVSALHRATWEICDAHVGTAEDFKKLELGFASLDFHEAILRQFRGEIAVRVDAMQSVKRYRQDVWTLFPHGSWRTTTPFDRFVARAIPSGVFDLQCALLADGALRGFVQPAHSPSWQALLQATRDSDRRSLAIKTQAWTHPSDVLTMIAMPVMHTITARAMFSQMLVDQCVVACALERYRIENGSYPETLDSVRRADGSALPLDPTNGEPMRYRKTPNGRYTLWSVGFDGKDDGGKRTLNPKDPELTKLNDVSYVGDWVWDFPE